MSSLAEQDVTQEQRVYIHDHLSQLKGMMGELLVKKQLIRSRFEANPEKTAFFNRELNSIEGQIDAILISLEFIENWPGSCIGVCCDNCDYADDCPAENCR